MAPNERLSPLEVSYTDDPRVVKEAATEDYTTHVVPHSWRVGKLPLSMSWSSISTGMFYLVTAATLAAVVGAVDTVIGILLASVFYGVVGDVFARYASRTGVTAALLSQRLFGTSASIIVPLIIVGTSIYYAVFESTMIAHAFDAYIGGLSIEIWFLISVAMNLPLVMGSVRRLMARFNAILLPIYWGGFLFIIFFSAKNADVSGWFSESVGEASSNLMIPGWLYAFFVYLGVLSLIMFSVDFARLGKPRESKFNGHVIFGIPFYLIVFLANGLIGVFLGYAAGVTEALSKSAIVDYSVALLGGWGLLIIWVTQARINSGNFYVGSVNLAVLWGKMFHVRLPRVVAVLVCGVLVYAFMLAGDVLSYVLVALAWMGACIGSWVGVALAHMWLSWSGDKNGLPEFRPGRVAGFTFGAWIWLIISAGSVALFEFGGTFGATWSTPISLVLAGGLYAVGYKMSAKKVLLSRSDDPRDEVDDIWEARIRCHVCARSYVAVEMDRDPSITGKPAICTACAMMSRSFRKAAVAEGVVGSDDSGIDAQATKRSFASSSDETDSE